MKTTRPEPLLIVLGMALTACGSSGGTDVSPPSPPPSVPSPPMPPTNAPPTNVPPPEVPTGSMPPTPASCAAAQPTPPRPSTPASAILGELDQSSTPDQLNHALSRVSAILAANDADADAHYVRGVLLGALGAPPPQRLVEYERAFTLDPRFADAAYNAGSAHGALGDHERAIAWFERAVSVAPDHTDAQYNLGQSAYNLGRFERALDAFLCARAQTPEPFDETKKVVQCLHALGRFAEAGAAREAMWGIRRGSSHPRLARMTEAVIDQLRVENHLVMVSETAPPAVEPDLRYVYVARAYVREGSPPVAQVQLETSAVVRELGTAALIGYQQGPTHATTRIGFTAMPTYEQVRPTLEDVIGRLLRGEPVAAGASSTPTP